MTVLEWLGYLLCLALAIPFLGVACIIVMVLWYSARGWIKRGPEEEPAAEELVNAGNAE